MGGKKRVCGNSVMTVWAPGTMELLWASGGKIYMKCGLGERNNWEPGFVCQVSGADVPNTSESITSSVVVWVMSCVTCWVNITSTLGIGQLR